MDHIEISMLGFQVGSEQISTKYSKLFINSTNDRPEHDSPWQFHLNLLQDVLLAYRIINCIIQGVSHRLWKSTEAVT